MNCDAMVFFKMSLGENELEKMETTNRIDEIEKNEFSFKLAFRHYGKLWSSLRLCPGIKRVSVARDEVELINQGYHVFQVITELNGIYIPSFQYHIFKPLIDNGWKYDNTSISNHIPRVPHLTSTEIFTCLGQDCFNRHLIPPHLPLKMKNDVVYFEE